MKIFKITIYYLFFIFSSTYAANEKDGKANVIVSVADQLSSAMYQIRAAAIQYYKKLGFWPSSVDELKIAGYIPRTFEDITSWGAKWELQIIGDKLNILIKAPEEKDLGDVAAESEVLNVASRAVKALIGSKKRFAKGDKSLSQTATEQKNDNNGEQAFERGNIEKKAIIKELTITDDKNYLAAANLRTPLSREPSNFVRIRSTLADGVQITTDSGNINFNNKVNFKDAVSATKFLDNDNSAFYLDPSKESKLNQLAVSKIIDADDDEFFIDPSDESIIKDLRVNSVTAKDLYVDTINGGTPVTLEGLSQVAITKMQSGKNIAITDGKGRNRTVGFVNIGVVDDPVFNSVNIKNDLNANGNLYVGGTTESIINDNFSLDGNDAFIKGDLGVNGTIYSNGSLILNSGDNSIAISGDDIRSSGNLIFKTNNNNNNNLKLSSDGNDVSLETTGNSSLDIKANDNITFQTNSNNLHGINFKNTSGDNILSVDSINKRVGINLASVAPSYALDVGGTLHAQQILVDAQAGDLPIKVSRTNPGQWLGFNDGSDSFGIYNFASTYGGGVGLPYQEAANNANITANIGSIAIDTVEGNLYIKRSDNSNSTWKVVPNASSVFLQGGNTFGKTATIGSNDANKLILETNNTVAITIDTNQDTKFTGNINLSNKDITVVDTLSTANIKSSNGSSYNILLDDNKPRALSIKDGSNDYLVFDSLNSQINLKTTATFGANLVNGSNFDINGGTIDNVIIGASVPLISLAVGDLTLSGNSINTTAATSIIDFGANQITTSGVLTVGGLDLNGSSLLNLGDLALDSLSPSGNAIAFNLKNNKTNAFSIVEGANNYLSMDTTAGSEKITIGKDLALGTNNISGNSFDIKGGTIDGAVIGANNAATATFTTLSASTLGSNIDINNKELSNVNIISGSVNGISNLTVASMKVGDLTFNGNNITSTSNISFGSNNLVVKGNMTVGSIDLSGSKLANIGDITLDSLSAAANKLNINLLDKQITALDITEGANSYLKFDTSNNMLVLGQTFDFNNKDLKNIKIASGIIDGTSIGATTPSTGKFTMATVDDLRIDGNSITPVTGAAGTINLVGDVDIIGTLSFGSLNTSGISLTNLDDLAVNSLSAATNDISIQLTDNRAAALDIKEGTNSYLKFITTNANEKIVVGKTLELGATAITGSNFNITGGTINGATISSLSSINVGNLTISGNQIISNNNTVDFGSNDLNTTGKLIVSSIDVSNSSLSAIGDIALSSISPKTNTINFDLGNNAAALDIRNGIDSYLTFDTTNSKIIVGKTLELGNTNIIGTNFNIDGGSIDGVKFTIGATNPIQSIKVGSLAFSGNSINSTDASNTIDFGNNDIITTGSIIASNINSSGVDLTDIGNIFVTTIKPTSSGQITIALADNNATALDISQGGISYLKFRTTNGSESIDAGSTKFSGSNFNITGGTISGMSKMEIGDLIFNGNKITSRNGFIDFDDEDLVTKGNISAPSATISSANNSGPVLNITNSGANGSRGIDIDLDNAAANASDFITFAVSGSTVGRIRYDGGVSVINVSDRKTKTHINDTRLDANNILTNLRIVDYNRKNNPNGDLITGFIAQEVQMVFSDMVGQVTPNLLGISEIKLIPILVKGHQQQQTQIDKLNNAIAIGNNKINFNKALNVNNKQVVDIHGNITARDLTIEQDIIVNQKLSIKRSDTLANLMTINKDKTADKTAEGYLSVKDVYLADRGEWGSTPMSEFIVFARIPDIRQCNNESQSGNMGIVESSEKLYVCLGVKGWKSFSVKKI